MNVVDHEIGHARNARAVRPLSSGATAESLVELRTQVGSGRTAAFQRSLGFAPSTVARQSFYEQPLEWIRGLFHRAGSTTDAAIAADLAAQPEDHRVLNDIAVRLLDRHGIDRSWLDPAAASLHAPEYGNTAANNLKSLDELFANTPRNITYEAWQRSRGA